MKENVEETMEKIIAENELPEEKKNNIRVHLFVNLLLAIFIIVYFAILIFGSRNALKQDVIGIFYSFSLVFLVGAIVLFEIAYRKDSGSLTFNGLELLAVALITLIFPYSVFELSEKYKVYIYFLDAYVASYYLIKSIIMYFVDKRKYEKEKMGDIREIIEPIEQERRESVKAKDKKETPKKNSGKAKKKTKRESKKEEKNEKAKAEEVKIEEKIEEKPQTKKRGRPKKQVENKNKEVKKELKKEETKVKKTKSNTKSAVKTSKPKSAKAVKKEIKPKKIVREEDLDIDILDEINNKQIESEKIDKEKEKIYELNDISEIIATTNKRGRPKKE